MDYSKKKDLLKRFRDRQLSHEEYELFFKLMKEGKFSQDFNQLLDETEEQDENIVADKESILKIKKNLQSQISGVNKRKQLISFRSLSVAASLLIIMGIGFGSYHLNNYWKTKNFITVNVPTGELYTLTLKDGSIIKLISGSVFKYPEAFENNQRRVYLIKGQGMFQVAHDKSRPFTVKSGKLATTALGTSFTVQYNRKYKWEKVSLYTGKVVIKEDAIPKKVRVKPVFLIPGQAYEVEGNKKIEKNFNPMLHPLSEGDLSFSSTPFEEAVYQVSSYYNINIHFDRSDLENYHVNGEFHSRSPEEVLQTLTHMYHLTLNKTNDSTYYIMKKMKK